MSNVLKLAEPDGGRVEQTIDTSYNSIKVACRKAECKEADRRGSVVEPTDSNPEPKSGFHCPSSITYAPHHSVSRSSITWRQVSVEKKWWWERRASRSKSDCIQTNNICVPFCLQRSLWRLGLIFSVTNPNKHLLKSPPHWKHTNPKPSPLSSPKAAT